MATKNILVNPSNKSVGYFECDQFATEPAMYRCLDPKHCEGKIGTPHGYWLICLHDCKMKDLST